MWDSRPRVPAGSQGTAALPIAIIPPTETPTEVPTETPTAVPTQTPTEVPTATETPTEVPTETATATASEEPTVTETATEEPTATETSEPRRRPRPKRRQKLRPKSHVHRDGDSRSGNRDTGCDRQHPDQYHRCGRQCTGWRLLHGTSGAASAEVCDNDQSDQEPGEGIVEIGSLPAGDYTVHESKAPDGYTAPVDQTATITNGGDVVELTFVNAQTPVATGTLRITSVDQDGNPVGGGCYQISTTEVCDNLNNDAENAPGVIVIEGIRSAITP